MTKHREVDVQKVALLAERVRLLLDDVDESLRDVEVDLTVLNIGPVEMVGEPFKDNLEFPAGLRGQFDVIVHVVRQEPLHGVFELGDGRLLEADQDSRRSAELEVRIAGFLLCL